MKEIETFYSKLYSSDGIDKREVTAYIDNCEVQYTLSEEENVTCEGELKLEECTAAVKNFKPNKSPGSDGLSGEFYKTFWDDISDIVLGSLNDGYRKGELSNTQKLGVVTLIYKKNDPLLLQNWRPITLLNLDYKIAAYVLASRLKPLMKKLVSTDQNGYIKDRFIGYNIRQIQDVIDYSEKFNIDSCLLFLDFTKAFDTIEWDFMFSCLDKFGFGRSFIKWVKVLYTNIKGCVKNNNWLTGSYVVSRGIRQGCPLSCLIFVLAAELLAQKIRTDVHISGISIRNRNMKISQLADDTTLFMRYRDIRRVLSIVEQFGKVSGLQLNKSKTEGLYLGCNKEEN
ncbi:hypothetical protein CI610_03460 [invertebrate metagenome]|uniref:Reverse transcriptase domain-containing protein n=1 Tax=invertebrate metagenome TaxID=1711999 RepID=A0A2H9T309_9ZZZZ